MYNENTMDRREKRSATYWDTVYFDEGSRPGGKGTLFLVHKAPHRIFVDSDDGSGRTNMRAPGCFPQYYSFHIRSMGIRLDLDGECPEDAARALLRCLRLTLVIGNMDSYDVPPGVFYPKGGQLPSRSLFRGHTIGTERKLPPYQNFHVRIDLVANPGHRLLLKLQKDALLRGELAVMLNGIEFLDVL